MAVRLFLVRHGAVIPPKPNCIYGAMDVELSELGRREAIHGIAAEARRLRTLSPADAASLRGKKDHLSSTLMGRCGRVADAPLIARQYHDSHSRVDAGSGVEFALDYIMLLAERVPARTINFGPPARPLLLVWSDAFWEEDRFGLAYVLDAGSVADVATGRLKRRLCLSLRRGATAAASAREAVAAEPAVASALLALAAATRERRRGGRRLRLEAPADVDAACDAKRLPPCCLPAWLLVFLLSSSG